ncbi:MAG: hypothetical protein IT236_03700 [Bacteroidia bacterium]|nr:hypothetical protein [Bacteroidia bacterium]
MDFFNALINKEWKLKLLLFVTSFVIYFGYFHHIFFHLNSLLSSATSDTIKNYYTYVYHIKNDAGFLHFTGMSYPYGEHAVYTDCQPILTFVLRCLPFTHGYLIGILHGLIFLSFIISPLIIYGILKRFDFNKLSAFFVALAVALLAPQFLKINAGHHGLTYACIIPLSVLFTLNYQRTQGVKSFWTLFSYHCFLFLLHPYMGFSVAVFCFMALLILQFLNFGQQVFLKNFIRNLFVCVVPVILFKLFMILTDTHPNRTTEPYGLDVMVENVDSILAPVFGPFKTMMEIFFNKRPDHYEGHSYVGAFSILLSLLLMVLLATNFKKIKFRKEMLAIFVSSLILLFISFGWHTKFFGLFGLKVEFMNQFRAVCRFAWFFYYGLALFLAVTIFDFISQLKTEQLRKSLLIVMPLLFFGCNLWEADAMFKMDKEVFWKSRNVFNKAQLHAEELKVLSDLEKTPVQAIVPLPMFESGSEMYDRVGFNNSMLPAMMYSYHSGLPIFSSMMSRTSMSETENEINLLNGYKADRPAVSLLNEKQFFVITTKDALLPDEMRLLPEVRFVFSNDSSDMGYITKTDFLKPKAGINVKWIENKTMVPDSNNLIYLPFENRKPFIASAMNNMERITTLDSNLVQSGEYVVSLRYYYTQKRFQALACNLIVTEGDTKDFKWKYDVPLRFLSGFYPGYAVFEYPIIIDRKKKYDFVIAGRSELEYKISDFMLRPLHTTVAFVVNGRDTVYNNFPR